MKKTFLIFASMLTLFSIFSCSTIPKGAEAVSDFDKARYLGKWYEIARLDNSFEAGLNNTIAEYTLKENGKIKVTNRGYDYTENRWKEAIGKAKFVGKDNVAMLKVSFFGPFYAGYNVLALDENYQYALVSGSNLKYLWILSREKSIPDDIKESYLKIAKNVGFDTSKLLWVEHNK